MIRPLPLLSMILLLVCSLITSTLTAQPRAQGLLFAVTKLDSIEAECIAVLTDTGIVDPHSLLDEMPEYSDKYDSLFQADDEAGTQQTTDSLNGLYYASIQRFNNAFLPPRFPLTVLKEGIPFDTITISNTRIDSFIAVVWMGGTAISRKHWPQTERSLLGVSLPLTPHAVFRSDSLNAKETKSVKELATTIFKKKKTPSKLLKKLEVISAIRTIPFSTGEERIIANVMINDGDYTFRSILMVLKRTSKGFEPEMQEYLDGNEESTQIPMVIGLVDVDGDGTAELVTSKLYYESMDYQIWKWTAGKWVTIYQGGGSGV